MRDAARTASSIGIALSGGVDSSVLLDACVAVFGAARCIAFHIHHGLQTAADDWLAHCETVCTALGVRFVSHRVTLPASGAGEGIEAAARVARYDALRALADAQSVPIVLLGHHADDQAETVMLQLLRGAGLPGLSAMPEAREDQAGGGLQWCRPLLALTRESLERYAHCRGLRWIDDGSNADRRFARNALRHDVMPAIAAHFPAYRATLARVARHAAASQQLLDTLADEDLVQCRIDSAAGAALRALGPAEIDPSAVSREDVLALEALRARSPARVENLLRHWVRLRKLPAPTTARLAEMVAQIIGKGSVPGQRASIAHAGQWLHIYRGKVYWSAASDEAPAGLPQASGADVRMVYEGQAQWALPDWRGYFAFSPVDVRAVAEGGDAALEAGTADGVWIVPSSLLLGREIAVRGRVGGERMRLNARRPLRSLKQLYQAAAVPAWQRTAPLLYVDEQLCYVPYVGGFLPEASSSATQRLSVRWCPWVD